MRSSPVRYAQWWFGYEPGGPSGGTKRPLDRSRAALYPYLETLNDALQCPSFPYDHSDFYEKFDGRSASYGFNLNLGPSDGGGPIVRPTARITSLAGRMSQVFIFADGIHFDFNPGFNEGHYIMGTPAPAPTGYGHFRHDGLAQILFLDGHVGRQRLRDFAFPLMYGGVAGNLTGPDGSYGSIAGF